MDTIYTRLGKNPIIASVKTPAMLDKAIASPVEVIFMLAGNICELNEAVAKVNRAGKMLALHIDLIDGMGKDYYALKYLSENVKPDGIITTKANLVKYAKEFGIFTIQRMFMLDSMCFDNALKYTTNSGPRAEAIEVLPGVIPSIIRELADLTHCPIIAGGLIRDKNDTIQSLRAGAVGISTSCEALWYS
ncbi:MAG TPA: glycerol-3-phosphate responsive antiterminator [Candidatus Limiplasma sp.]|nr:glycerol-3-phosphate responsive antiterminator [Candidatus Limiplasma sp.]